MPEIKNTFTGGKMNKDLDERLVPNGEYRDAMNIEVSTSDASHVGTIQNLVGNTLIPSNVDTNNYCVGSIADEKNDSLYWLNAGDVPPIALLEAAYQDNGSDNTATFVPWSNYWISKYGATGMSAGQTEEWRDTIWEYTASNLTTAPVFVDVYKKWFKPSLLDWFSGPPMQAKGNNLLIPTGGLNGIQVGSKINIYYSTNAAPLQHLVKNEHTVTAILPQTDLSVYLPTGGYPANTLRDLIEIDPGLNLQEIDAIGTVNTSSPLYNNFWFCEIENKKILNFQKNKFITGINIVDDMLFWTDNNSEPKKINIPRSKQGTDSTGLIHTNLIVDNQVVQPIELGHVTVIKKAPSNPPTIELDATAIPYTSTTIMNHAMRTDDCVDHEAGDFGRDTVVHDGNIYFDWHHADSVLTTGTLPEPGEEKIMTFMPVDMGVVNEDYPEALGNIPYKNGDNAVGDTVIFRHREDEEDYVRGIIIQEIVPCTIGNYFPLGCNWNNLQPINVPYASWDQNQGWDAVNTPLGCNVAADNMWYYRAQRMFKIQLISISQDTPLGWQFYDVRMETSESNLFEKKFPRIATRYRYEDGEYSSFGPFTDAVFAPGTFEYDSKNAYNKGMINHIKRIHVKDFVNEDTPADVVQVDILYKDEDSSNIYVVDNIKPTDTIYPLSGSTLNSWYSPGVFSQGWYTIESESIFTALPSNQLLRPWDNVPRKALAQDVVGNRVVYGNYLQNYDLIDDDNVKITPWLEGSVRDRISAHTEMGFGNRSVKSEREYQIGVTYSDEFGRESSVLAGSGGTFEVPKPRAQEANAIYARVLSNPPTWATHFKIFVKETSSEYYNLAMDRVYKAEDEALWLSFPSAERNKIDEETYLILKKGADTDVAVTDVSKYKVVAIENEAPEYIKTSYKVLGDIDGEDVTTQAQADLGLNHNFQNLIPGGLSATNTNIPQTGVISFVMAKDVWDVETGSPLEGDNPYYITFRSGGGSKVTERYKVVNFSIDSDADNNNMTGAYNFTLEKPITAADGWIEDPDGDGTNLSTIGMKIEVKLVENKPEFDGRFFVKILRDSIIDTWVTPLIKKTNTGYIITHSASIPWLANADASSDGFNTGARIGIDCATQKPTWLDQSTSVAPVTTHSSSNETTSHKIANWSGYSGVLANGEKWFIDNMYYAGTQNLGTENPSGSYSFPAHGFNADGSTNNSLSTSTPPYPENYGKGIYMNNSGEVWMEISFSKLGTNRNWNQLNTKECWEEAENLTDPGTLETKMIAAFKKQDQKFHVAGNEEAYMIVEWHVERRYNHTSWLETFPSDPSITGNHINANTGDGGIATHQPGLANFIWNELNRKLNQNKFGKSNNRRLTYKLRIKPVDINDGVDFITYLSGLDLDSTGITFDFVEDFVDSSGFVQELSDNPAIWETEPKQKEGLDIYYEATRKYPGIVSTDSQVENLIPSTISSSGESATMSVISNSGPPAIANNSIVKLSEFRSDYGSGGLVPWSGIRVFIDTEYVNLQQGNSTTAWDWDFTTIVNDGDFAIFSLPDGSTISLEHDMTKTIEKWDLQPMYAGGYWYFKPRIWGNELGLSWYNCFSFGNGVESDRIRDDFNTLMLSNGVKVSRPGEDQYKEQRLKGSLIFSGLYNAKSGINNLNQFIAAEGITKDLNPTYGSIQKLHARDTDLITFCEDKVLKVLSNKDAVYNADENPQLLATNRVLGQTIPFSGEYGISKNPESFASEAHRIYFTDKQRGKVLRLSRDGITPISDYGMNDWFIDNLKIRTNIYGSYDTKRDNYNLTLLNAGKDDVLSFSEKVKGWTSFKSYVQESGLSLSGEYYTIKHGKLWQHHVEAGTERNRFYGQHADSTVNVLLNANPEIVKNFQTLDYEGTQSKIVPFTQSTLNGVTYSDNQYYNLQAKKGWYVESIVTNCQDGAVPEFIEKECKWFNYIQGKHLQTNFDGVITSDIDTAEFSFQGIANVSNVQILTQAGCTDDTADNYDSAAITDDGSCYYNPGCTDSTMFNYDSSADFNDGSCIDYESGCQDATALNYCDTCNQNDPSSCIYTVYGCLDSTMFNYDGNANTPCDDSVGGCTSPACNGPGTGSGQCCVANLAGCTDPAANNYNSAANTDDGSCSYEIYGCTDSNADNYNDLATVACNVNATGPGTNECCEYSGCMWTSGGSSYGSVMNGPGPGFAQNYNPMATHDCSGDLAGSDFSCCSPCTFGVSAGVGNGSDIVLTQGSCDASESIGSLCVTATNNDVNLPLTSPASYHFIVGIREVGCISSGGYPDWSWGWDTTVEVNGGTWNDSCVITTSIVSVDTSSSPIIATASFSGLNPGTEYEAKGMFMCDTQFYGYDAITPLDLAGTYSNWLPSTDPITLDPGIEGCTDSTAFNYNPDANTDDGSCETIVTGCMDENAYNYNPDANIDAGCLYLGCIDPDANNYNSSAIIGCDITGSNSCCVYPEILGCTNPDACNYNSAANTDDGTCEDSFGCTNPLACNYNENATCDDGSCNDEYGCMDATACNYNPNANCDIWGCGDIPVATLQVVAPGNTGDNGQMYLAVSESGYQLPLEYEIEPVSTPTHLSPPVFSGIEIMNQSGPIPNATMGVNVGAVRKWKWNNIQAGSYRITISDQGGCSRVLPVVSFDVPSTSDSYQGDQNWSPGYDPGNYDACQPGGNDTWEDTAGIVANCYFGCMDGASSAFNPNLTTPPESTSSIPNGSCQY